jgi:lysophospholipase
MAGNNYPTISYLKENLWEQAFQDSLLVPDYLLVAQAYGEVVSDITAKGLAGFPPTLTDPWGRLLSYQLLNGPDGGVDTTLSSVVGLSNFTSHSVPYPVMLTLGVKTFNGECLPGPNATTYEFSPYEFGSWDSDVSAFTPTQYLGTSLSGGQPTTANSCVVNYDNLGYILGSASSLFNEVCAPVPPASNSTTDLNQDLAEMVVQVHSLSTRDEYAVYPNPFYAYNSSTGTPNPSNAVWTQQELHLVDGGESLQNNPIWPFLQPARGVDVMIVNDNSADTSNYFPNGSEILTTYVQSQNANLTRMPYIPSVDTFLSEGLNKRATFFGCNATDKITIVYLPNVNITYQSNQSTLRPQYSVAETEGMIGNGVAVANQGGESGWATCLGCAIMMKTGTKLPAECQACFQKYCYYQ